MQPHDWKRRLRGDTVFAATVIVVALVVLAFVIYFRIGTVSAQAKWASVVQDAPPLVTKAQEDIDNASRAASRAEAANYEGSLLTKVEGLLPVVEEQTEQLRDLGAYLTVNPLGTGKSALSELDPYSDGLDGDVEIVVENPEGYREMSGEYRQVADDLEGSREELSEATEKLTHRVDQLLEQD